ncbi:MAG: acyl-[ACP]--phospholipid O-acyltransferase [Alphaproteobacteria bacterium]|nr:acyl-[ACP]--phospholipid O-acyltransferase [Alphaproteobacteria bacterium]
MKAVLKPSSPNAALFSSRRFLPMFAAQFLGALEDNLFRNAVFVLVAFQLAAREGYVSGLVISLGAGLFILPFFLFSATAGTLADRMEKTRLVRWLMFTDFVLMFFAGCVLVTELVPLLLITMFLLGLQSAFFGPVKYSILPQLMAEKELIETNAYVQGGTFVAILIGTIIGGATVTLPYGTIVIASLMTILAFSGWLFSLFIPRTEGGETGFPAPKSLWTNMWPLLRETRQSPSLWRAILGISWFWFVGALFLSLLPNYVKDVLGGTPALVTFLLTLFVVGTALGAAGANRALRGEIDTRFVPFGVFVMAAAVILLSVLSRGLTPDSGLASLPSFLTHFQGVVIGFLFLLMAAAGGFYTVPFYAVLQSRGNPGRRARVIASNNIMNALFMAVSSVFSFALFKLGFGTAGIFLTAGLLSLVAAAFAVEYLPYRIFSSWLRLKFFLLYGAKVTGRENVAPLKHRGVVYIVNHTSLLDGLLLAAFLPGCPIIAANPAMARKWWMRFYYFFAGHPAINPADPAALKYLVGALKEGRSVAIFPEGRLTQTGLLMKVYETPGVIAGMAKAPLVPVRIDGAQYTPFSTLRGKMRLKWFPRLTIKILPPVTLKGGADLSSREKRHSYSDQLYDIMANMLFASYSLDQTLYEAFLDAGRVNGPGTKILEDLDRQPRSYKQIVLMSRILGRKFTDFTAKGKKVGVMLPNGVGVVGVFFGLLAYGRVPTMLNFAGGLANLQSALITADIDEIITSRRFVKLLELEQVVEALGREANIVYLEDLRKDIGLIDKLRGLAETYMAGYLYRKQRVMADDPAVVLFTSGSESTPKGVVLSHKNIIANRYQAATPIDLNAGDVLFTALPVFHSFGLSVGLMLPLLSGVRTFLYPSPLHYRIIPELIYETNATILISTDTFLGGYARMAHPYDFYSLRYAVAGGEKLKEDTRRMWSDKFGIRILEGYGVTETAPVLAINTAMHNKTGTVGRLVPGMEYRLRKIEGIETGGSLVVRGPNVMLGYLKSDRPGVLQPPEGGWYDTGDIVEVDDEGYVKIIGRAKRFAKIGSEMISLAAVEALVQAAAPEKIVAVVAVPDARKGEQMILYTDSDAVTREKIVDIAQERKLPEIMIPRQIVKLDEVPLLGTGKVDYVKLNKMASGFGTSGFLSGWS